MVPAPQNGTMSAQGMIAERSAKAVESLGIRERLASPAPPAPAPQALAPKTDVKPAKAKTQHLPDLTKDMATLATKLNAAARDIVEAVEGSLPRDIEKKYMGGETDIYTKRVFEGLGKRLERTIADRDRGDRMMRSRVDSYIRLFERMLDGLSAVTGGEALIEGCLAAIEGRIYVTLAETAGRIPPQS